MMGDGRHFARSKGSNGPVVALLLLATLASKRDATAGGRDTSLPDGASIYRLAAPSVVMIEAQVAEGVSQGSGVVVGNGQIVTNSHVVEGSRGFVLIHQGNRTWRSEIEQIDKANDLALLGVVLRRNETFGLSIARTRKVESLRIGERAYAIGSPRGLERTFSDGLVSGLPGNSSDTIIQTTAAISPGSSGGGLFDSRAQLIGITTVYLKDSQNLNFAIASNRIEALEKAPPSRKSDYAFPSDAQPASQSTPTTKPPDLPTPLGRVRAVIVMAASDGPVSTEGGITADWIKNRVSNDLRSAGIGVYSSQSDAAKARVYALPLSVEVSSMRISDTALYPWRIDVNLMDTADFVDGTNGIVTTWQETNHGYGGRDVVVDQVSRELGILLDKFAIAALRERAKQ